MAEVLACRGGTPVRTKPWLKWPDPREEDVRAVSAVVASGNWWSYAGEDTVTFEREFAAYQDATYGVTVNSGTTALHVGLLALGIGAGDEVIVPAYTFQATPASVLLSNAVPVFADVEPDTMNLDPKSVAQAITPRTKAIIPVHIAGLPADMERLGALAAQHHLLMLEDSAQAHGAVWRGRKVGAIGHAGAFSFQASKNLCSGEGGFITTNDPEVGARAAGLRNCGRAEGRPFYEHHLVGFNFRLTEMQGALLRTRLRHLEAETERRFRNGRWLTAQLSPLPGIRPLDPEPREGDRRAYHLYPVRIDSEQLDGLTRDTFMQALSAEGIPAMAGYGGPLYRNPVYRDGRVQYRALPCPVTEQLSGQIIWLPQNVLLGSEEDTADIARAFGKIVTGRAALLQ